MAIAALNGVKMDYTNSKGKVLSALSDINLQIHPHEFVCLIGKSGCGKTTLLNLLAGLLKPSGGVVEILGKPLKKPIGEAQMVFQEYSLLPWRNILDNVGLGLELRGLKKDEWEQKAQGLLDTFGLEEFGHFYPHELSGGMRQRAAIARAMTTDPKLLYMDEPFGALDAQCRLMMQDELLKFWLESKPTVVFVTHSIEEAVFLGSRIVVLGGRPGKVVEDISVELPYPRDRWNTEFGQYCKHLLSLLQAEPYSFAGRKDAQKTPILRHQQKSCC